MSLLDELHQLADVAVQTLRGEIRGTEKRGSRTENNSGTGLI